MSKNRHKNIDVQPPASLVRQGDPHDAVTFSARQRTSRYSRVLLPALPVDKKLTLIGVLTAKICCLHNSQKNDTVAPRSKNNSCLRGALDSDLDYFFPLMLTRLELLDSENLMEAHHPSEQKFDHFREVTAKLQAIQEPALHI